MSLNSQTLPLPPDQPRGVKQMYFQTPPRAGEPPWTPCFYAEARIDYADVRSGFHMICGLNHVLDLESCGEDLLWTRDMVRTVDPALIRSARPADVQLSSLPAYVNEELLRRFETQYLSFLLRHAEVRVYRNFVLNIYSHPGETLSEFRVRCRDLFNEAFRGELDAMREVVNRRLEHIEQKYIGRNREGEFESERRMTQARSRLHSVAEGITELFLRTELTPEPAGEDTLRYPDLLRPDLEQTLESLETDVHRDIRRLLSSYQEKVGNIDEYIIHPGLKDLHLVRRCILWMPAGAVQP